MAKMGRYSTLKKAEATPPLAREVSTCDFLSDCTCRIRTKFVRTLWCVNA